MVRKILRMTVYESWPYIIPSPLNVGGTSAYDGKHSGDCYFTRKKGDYVSGSNLITQAL